MKITAIKTFIVDGGFRPWTFVKVETSEPGLVGWGDCTDWGSPDRWRLSRATAVGHRARPYASGSDFGGT
ncbi:MAG: hypothetical protein R2867_07465 [Caldilineaceae bacterium]